jgi:holo-[acyl-carrier protein] synthase
MIRRRGGQYSAAVVRALRPRAAAAPRLYGTGVDVLQISRMAQVYARHPERLASRLLHPLERSRLENARDPINFLSKCFAVKEAFVKALGTGFRGVTHDDVGWVRGALGKPELVMSTRLQQQLVRRGVGAAHLTISDEVDLICAVVILEARY